MDVLSELRYCLQVADLRETIDPENRWRWAIRRKVLRWSVARMERVQAGESSAARGSTEPPAALERQRLEASHPLLRPMAMPGLSAFEPNTAWRASLRVRVAKYMAALKARRST